VCAEKLIGAAQEFSLTELEDTIMRSIDPMGMVARNPCLRRGPLTWEYWTRLPAASWRALRALIERR
jgi:hypothetical protein